MKNLATGLFLALFATATATHALEFDLAGGTLNIKNKLSSGIAIRTQGRNDDLVGKLNVDGQQNLCAKDNCISLKGDPEPNRRLVNARGNYFAVNADDGDLNYNRYDLVAATTKLATDLVFEKGEFLARLRAVGYYDPVNAEFDTRHPNTNYQPARTKRPGTLANNFAKGVRLYDAFVQYNTEIAGHTAVLSVGQQTLRWGESNLVAINSVSEINPPNANFLRMPGSEINEVFQPVPIALLSTDLFDGASAEFLYQFGWKRIEPDASGSFYSDNDIAGDGRTAILGLGQFGEDPDRKFRLAGALGLISSTSVTVYPEERKAPSQGQYGVRLNYNATSFNGGTEFGFYFLNYHSRLPYASVISTNESCARDSTDAASALAACNGFKGTLINAANGKEPLPIDTLRVLLEYPKNVKMLGVSFNTTIGKVSVSGEYAFRPSAPLQVQLPDLVFAGLQPAFPVNDIEGTPGGTAGLLDAAGRALGVNTNNLPAPIVAGLAELGESTLPSATHGIPSFLATYRNLGRIGPNQYIRGYIKRPTGQFDLTGIRIWSANPFAADQVILLGEVGFTHIIDLPKLSELQINGGTAIDSHYGAGADGTGLTAANSCRAGAADAADPNIPSNYTCKLNPHQQTRGFAESFSWGLRSLVRMEYNNAIFGWSLKPTFGLTWDVEGTGPAPQQNFVQGRKELLVGAEVNITSSLLGRAFYMSYFGGKRGENTRSDRDSISMSFSYAF